MKKEDKFLEEGLSFDDVLLVPDYPKSCLVKLM